MDRAYDTVRSISNRPIVIRKLHVNHDIHDNNQWNKELFSRREKLHGHQRVWDGWMRQTGGGSGCIREYGMGG